MAEQDQEASSPQINRAGVISACIAEYNARRDEIGWLINGAQSYQALSIALVCGFIGFLAGIAGKHSPYEIYVFLFTPPVLSLLGFLYFRQHQEVYVVAACIDQKIVPTLRRAIGSDDVFVWERHKASAPQGIKPAAVMVNFLRLLLFALPSLLALGAAASDIELPDGHMSLATGFQMFLWLVDALILVAFLWVAIFASNLPDLLRVPPPLPIAPPSGDALATLPKAREATDPPHC